ncbi:MAG: FKBP-type peptidyl-prolyl cis-trans isomerase [Alphaproteobacteria bacterium]|nr:FKBP-type peptidyl-prolyl cis-trans isomerase [Alphaproteobacteria bacterium]
MLKKTIFSIALAVLLWSCNSYEKTPSGMLFKIKHNGNNMPKINNYDIIKMNIEYRRERKDSMFSTTNGFLPMYLPYDSNRSVPFSIFEILPQARVGDDIEFIIDMDSIVKLGYAQYNPILDKHDRIIAKVNIIKKFTDQVAAGVDRQNEYDKLLKKETEDIRTYLKNKKITAKELKDGVFIQIEKTGDLTKKVDSGKMISVYYTGRIMSNDTIFDSNIIPKLDSPLTYQQGVQTLIPGWDIAIKELGLGGKAKFYIPSLKAYGANGAGKIPPYTNIYFEVEVIKIQDAPKPPKESSKGKSKGKH